MLTHTRKRLVFRPPRYKERESLIFCPPRYTFFSIDSHLCCSFLHHHPLIHRERERKQNNGTNPSLSLSLSLSLLGRLSHQTMLLTLSPLLIESPPWTMTLHCAGNRKGNIGLLTNKSWSFPSYFPSHSLFFHCVGDTRKSHRIRNFSWSRLMDKDD